MRKRRLTYKYDPSDRAKPWVVLAERKIVSRHRTVDGAMRRILGKEWDRMLSKGKK